MQAPDRLMRRPARGNSHELIRIGPDQQQRSEAATAAGNATSRSFGIGKGGFDWQAAVFWAFVGIPLAWGVWITLESAAKILQ